MAPIAPNALPRSKVKYTGYGMSHTLLLHWGSATSQATAEANAAAVINELRRMFNSDTVFDGHDFIPAGTGIGNPTAWTNVTGSSPGMGGLHWRARYVSFVGRGPDGRRIRLFLFGAYPEPTNNYRITFAEDSNVAAVVNYLNGASSPLVTVSGSKPVWKNYANSGVHDFLLKRIRRT